jgi:hypothetical protein
MLRLIARYCLGIESHYVKGDGALMVDAFNRSANSVAATPITSINRSNGWTNIYYINDTDPIYLDTSEDFRRVHRVMLGTDRTIRGCSTRTTVQTDAGVDSSVTKIRIQSRVPEITEPEWIRHLNRSDPQQAG